MKKAGFKTTLVRGLALAVPLAIIAYTLLRVVQIIRKIIRPVTIDLGIHRILGGATVTILAIALLLVIVLLLGLMMRLPNVSRFREKMEATIIRFVPSLNYLKLMAADKMHLETSQSNWKPVLVCHEEKYNAAFIVEENEELITLFVCKTTNLKDGELLITRKKDIRFYPANFEQLNNYSKAFGKGMLSLIRE